MQQVFPIGDHNNAALTESTTRAPGQIHDDGPSRDRIVADDSQLVIVQDQPNLSK